MKIGILLINNDPNYRGGTNSFISGLIEGLIKEDKKNEYYLLTYKKNSKYYLKYVTKKFHIKTFPDISKPSYVLKYGILLFFSVPILRNFYFVLQSFLYRSLIDLINQLNLDVLYSPTAPFFPMSLTGRLVASPHDIQQVHFPQYFSPIDRWVRDTVFPETFRKADVIQASSNFMKIDFQKSMAISPDKIVVIPEGVMDLFRKFKPLKYENNIFLKKYKLKSGYLFYPAQHWPHKNHITLLKAVMWIKKKYLMDVNVVFTGEKQQRFSYLYNFVEKNNLNDNVSFIGNVKLNDLLYAYSNASIVVVPGEYESSSLPVREAMAIGKPIIAARNGSNEEINTDKNILLFKTYDYKELADYIWQLLRNKKFRDSLVVRSGKVVKNYSWQAIARKYIDIWKSKTK